MTGTPPSPLPSRSAPEVLDERGRLAGLLRSAARGDEAAFAEVYDGTAARLHGLVIRVVRDRAQAEEVTQEVYLEAWRQSARFDEGKGTVLSWLMTIAHRRAVDRVRSAEANTRRDSTYEQARREVAHDQTQETAIANVEARRVRQAVATLTDAQRDAIELAYFGGYTHTEVATLLELPLGTAKTRIRDGLIRLRDALGVRS